MKNINGNINVLGIVAEYNPWHFGHEYQLEETKKICGAEYSVGIINGNFTQRGEPALLNKWARAEMALKGGMDLVVELPFYFGCNSAEFFAKGAVNILINSGIVTHMGFGSESGNMEKIKEVAEVLAKEPAEFKRLLALKMETGVSFPRARMEVIGHMLGEDAMELLKSPNNILAIEYVKSLISENSQIVPVTIERKGAGYHDMDCCQLASASRIRRDLRGDACLENMVPKTTLEIIERNRKSLVFKDNPEFYKLLQHVLLGASNNLTDVFSVSEGIENAFLKHVRTCENLEELLQKVKSKRYTYAGLSRIAAQMVVGFYKNQEVPKYIRVLGFTEKGQKLLKMIKANVKEPYELVTNVNKASGNLALDIRAQDVYNIISGENLYEKSDFVMKPVMVKK